MCVFMTGVVAGGCPKGVVGLHKTSVKVVHISCRLNLTTIGRVCQAENVDKKDRKNKAEEET